MKIRGFSTNIALTAFMLAFFSASAMAGVIWRGSLTAFSGDDSNTIYFAAADNATDGFENGYESRAIIQGKVVTYFYHPEWGVDTAYFWTEGKDTQLPKDWEFYVKSNYATVNMNWVVGEVPQTVGLSLVDEYTGNIADMRSNNSYTYANSSITPRKFTIRASGYLEAGAGISPAPAGDANPPETNIVTALPGFTSSSPVTIEYGGTDDVTLADALEFSYSVDNGAWSAWTNNKSASLTGLSDGTHAFSVKARDEAGNEDTTPATISFAMDTAPPSLALNTPEPAILWPVWGGAAGGRIVNAIQKTLKTLPGLGPVPGKKRSVTISGNASDAVSGLDGVLYVLSDEYGEFASSGNAAVSVDGGFSIVLQLMAQRLGTDKDGRTYTVTVTAVDKAGNRDVKSVTIKVPHDVR